MIKTTKPATKTIPEKLQAAQKIQKFFTPTAIATVGVNDDGSFRAFAGAGAVGPRAEYEDRVFLVDSETADKAVDGLLHEMFLSAQSGLLGRARGTFSDAKRAHFENALRELEVLVVG